MRILALLLLPLLLAGCPWNVQEPITAPAILLCDTPPKAEPFKALPVKPQVFVIAEDETFVGFSPQDYENMSRNLQAILLHIRQKNAIVEYYKTCIDNFRGQTANGERK